MLTSKEVFWILLSAVSMALVISPWFRFKLSATVEMVVSTTPRSYKGQYEGTVKLIFQSTV